MTDYGTIIGPGAIRFERELPGSIERIWAYLTESDRRAEWLAGGDMELHVDGAVRLDFRHAELTPVEEAVPEAYQGREECVQITGRITRCEPPRVLAYTWGENVGEGSEVTFELEPRGDGVLLILTHRLLEGRDLFISVAAGWHAHLGLLEKRLGGHAAGPFWSVHERLAREYRARLSTSPGPQQDDHGPPRQRGARQ